MIDNFRPCLALLLEPKAKVGRRDSEHLRTWKHLLTAECRERSVSKDKAIALVRQLYEASWENIPDKVLKSEADNYVVWAYGCPTFPISCFMIRQRAQHLCEQVRDNGFCPCEVQQTQDANRRRAQQRKQDRFEGLGWPQVLKELHGLKGQAAAACYLAIRGKMVRADLTYDDTIFITFRELQDRCRKEYHAYASFDTLMQAMILLGAKEGAGYGIITKTVQGKGAKPRRGRRGQSNGYQILLPTPEPPQPRLPSTTTDEDSVLGTLLKQVPKLDGHIIKRRARKGKRKGKRDLTKLSHHHPKKPRRSPREKYSQGIPKP